MNKATESTNGKKDVIIAKIGITIIPWGSLSAVKPMRSTIEIAPEIPIVL